MSRIIVLGGDGYIGWPLSLRLLNGRHEVLIVDNECRRGFDEEHGFVNRISSTTVRSKSSGIKFVNLDLSTESLKHVLDKFRPDLVIHAASQRSAPVSHDPKYRAKTFDNSRITLNVLESILEYSSGFRQEDKPRLIHFGSMGIYNNKEGALEPKSFYHMVKAQDMLMLKFYAKMYEMDITEIHSGTAWGFQTVETGNNPKFINREDHDYYYGTFINRFACQSFVGEPITVYGDGESVKTIVNIEDLIFSLDSLVRKKIESEYQPGLLRARNYYTQEISVKNAAAVISQGTGVSIEWKQDVRRERITLDNPPRDVRILMFKSFTRDWKDITDGLEPGDVKINQLKMVDQKW